MTVRTVYWEPWEMPVGFDDSHPDRQPRTVVHATGCRVCGSEDIAINNDNGQFCWDHEDRGMEWSGVREATRDQD